MAVFFPITSTGGGDAIHLKGCGHSRVPPSASRVCASRGTTAAACAGSEAGAGAMTLQKAFRFIELGKEPDGVKPYPGEHALTYGPDATLLG